MSLTSQQRKFLRGKAHHLDAVVIIGRQGLTDGVLDAVNQALNKRELIKIRFNDYQDQKQKTTYRIIEESGAELAGIIGHVAILYRPGPDPESRQFEGDLRRFEE